MYFQTVLLLSLAASFFLASLFLQNGLLLLGLAILGVVAGSLFITCRLLQPIKKITSELENIRPGENIFRLSERFPGEWCVLAHRFNQFLDDNDAYLKRHKEIITGAIQEKEKIFQIYRDVIYAVTQGKVFLVTEEEFYRQFYNELLVFTLKLEQKQDITRCRREVDIFLQEHCSWWVGPRRKQVLLSLSEALTNVIKHAGRGEISIALKEDRVIFYVLDQGAGMDLEKLPYMVFINGYTTKKSLGSGFLLMHYYIDRLIICTTDKGTYLALEANSSGFSCQAAENQR
jgi:anti-sigma regulatory factor (Ser/Thr protein kinase)